MTQDATRVASVRFVFIWWFPWNKAAAIHNNNEWHLSDQDLMAEILILGFYPTYDKALRRV